MDVPSLLSLVLAGPQVLGALIGSWLWARQLLARRRVVLQTDPDDVSAELLRTAADQKKFLEGAFELYPRLLPPESRGCHRAEVLTLPMHASLFAVFALRCAVWAAVCIGTVLYGDNVWAWGASSASRPSLFSEVSIAVMIALDASAIDGMSHFLSQESVSVEALIRCDRFRVMWGLLNGGVSIGFSAGIGGASHLDSLVGGRLPLWDPFFVRTILMIIFHLFLIVSSGRCGYSASELRVFGCPVVLWVLLFAFAVVFTYVANFVVDSEWIIDIVWMLGICTTMQNLLYAFLIHKAVSVNAAFWRQTWALSYHPLSSEGGISVDDYLALAGQDLQLADAPPALTLHKRLGSGGFSEVYQGTLRASVQVAVKVLKGERINEEGVRSFMHEVELSSVVRHQNVIHYVGASTADYALVMELCDGLSLEDRISANHFDYNSATSPLPLTVSQPSQGLFPNSLEHALFIALRVAEGCTYIHQQGILHRDLKPSNILFDEREEPKIADFGVAEFLASAKEHKTRFGGTVWYAAPELLATEVADPHPSSDVYSFGLILWELLTGQLVPRRLEADAKHGTSIEAAFSRTSRVPISWVYSRLQGLAVQQDVCSLVSDCLELPSRRPDFWHVCLRLRDLLSALKSNSGSRK